ncbi:MAG: dockerin type I repeat-containing protein [Planctomycetota bacterium]
MQRLACFWSMLFTVGLAGVWVEAQQALRIGNASLTGLLPSDVDVRLDSIAPTEGFVLAIGYDTSVLTVTSINVHPSLLTALAPAGAEIVSGEIFDAVGGCTLGVVFDATAPFAGQTLPPAPNRSIATIRVVADLIPAVPPLVSSLEFVDGAFNSPTLSNIIVQGGQSLGAGEISLVAGTVTLVGGGGINRFAIVGSSILGGAESGTAQVLLTNGTGPVEGFVLAIGHDPELTLMAIALDGTVTQFVGAEFVVPNINNTTHGGTLGVVLDFLFPYAGQTIPVGNDQLIAKFVYRCDEVPIDPEPPSVHPLTFVNGVFGSPPLENVVVMGGLSVQPEFQNGAMTCLPLLSDFDVSFFCGVLNEDGNIVDPVGTPEHFVEMCFFYTATTSVSGFQIAVDFDCCLEFIEGSFTIGGTVLDAVGAEFVNHNVDNDPHDGDGCEFVAGILLDALPPFDRQTVPATLDPLKIGGIQVFIGPDCECNRCYHVHFEDGVNGRGVVPIENVAVVDTTISLQQFPQYHCQVCVVAEPEFIRGDCNWDEKVNLADAAGMIAAQFLDYQPTCDDACDINDDGRLNLGDAVFLMNYLFKFGPEPPAPFPDPGPDETVDDPTGLHPELGCIGGIDPCPNAP